MRKIITAFFALAFSVSSAFAGGTISLMGIGPGQNEEPFSFELVSAAATSYSGSFGSAAATKLMVGVATCKSNVLNGTITATLNGAGMTQISRVGNSGSQSYVTVIAYGVSGSSTGSFSVSCSSAAALSAALFAVNNPSSTTPTQCVGTTSCTLTTTSGGALFGGSAAGSNNNASSQSGFSSGFVINTTGGGSSRAVAYGTASGGSETPSITSSNSFFAFAAASWR